MVQGILFLVNGSWRSIQLIESPMAGASQALGMFFSWPPGCHLLWVSSFPQSPCGSLPTFLFRSRGVSISKHPGPFLFPRLMGSHCGLTQGDGFDWWAFKISALFSVPPWPLRRDMFHTGGGGGMSLVHYCVLVTSQSKRKETLE